MSCLLIDLYELSMAQSYFLRGEAQETSFSYMVREAPFGGRTILVVGIDDVLQKIEALTFEEDDIQYLASLGRFDSRFLAYLRSFRFGGSLWSVEEGTQVSPYCPIIKVRGNPAELHLLSGIILNTLNHQCLIATKALRMVRAANGADLIELGLRRAHGVSAAIEGSKAAYVAGFSGSSNVAAGKQYGIPVFGSMAHSWVLNHADEYDAFVNYGRVNPHNCVLVIDTFDTLISGLPNALAAFDALPLPADGIVGVRIDSGDLAALSCVVRQRLDASGLQRAKIIVSGDLDESKIEKLVAAGSPIDTFGVGTRLLTGQGAGALEGVYKNNASAIAESNLRPALIKDGKIRQLLGDHVAVRVLDVQQNSIDIICLERDFCSMVLLLKSGDPIRLRAHSGEVFSVSAVSWSPLHQCKIANGVRIEPPRLLSTIRQQVQAGIADNETQQCAIYVHSVVREEAATGA